MWQVAAVVHVLGADGVGWQQAAAVVGLIIGIGGIIATVLFQATVRSQRDSVEFLTVANQGLRDALAESEKRREERSVQCAAEVAELRGQVSMLQTGLVERTASMVAEKVGEKIADHLGQAMERALQRVIDEKGRS